MFLSTNKKDISIFWIKKRTLSVAMRLADLVGHKANKVILKVYDGEESYDFSQETILVRNIIRRVSESSLH